MSRCAACARVRRLTRDAPLRDHICNLVDADLLGHLPTDGYDAPKFEDARIFQEAISLNSVSIGHFLAERYSETLIGHEFVTLSRDIHRRLYRGVPVAFGGEFRTVEGGFGSASRPLTGTPPKKIASAMQNLRQRLPPSVEGYQVSHVASCAAMLLYDFLQIHPFIDGNGRVARHLVRAFVTSTRRFQLRPFGEDEHTRDAYLEALQSVDAHERNDEIGPKYAPLVDWLELLIEEVGDAQLRDEEQ